MRTLSGAGRRALSMLEYGDATLDKFAASYWSEREALQRLGQAKTLLDALVDEGLAHRTITFGRHGPIYHLTDAGKAALA